MGQAEVGAVGCLLLSTKMYFILYHLLVVNYTKDGEYVNRDGGKWQLTTRLFLIDNVLARKDGAIDSSMSDYLRYARHLELRIKLKDNTGTGRINQPYFKVVYEDIPKQSYNNDLQVPTSFSVTYSMTRNKYNGDIEAALVILAGAGGVYGIVKTWGWSKRAGRIAIDFLTLVKMVLFACGPVGDMFFLVMFGAAFWDLIVFKNQDKVIFLMRNADEEMNFVIYVSCAFALKCLDVLHMLVNQVTIDIFLIDWEKPRGKVSIPRSNNSEEQTKTAPVSIWRTYFVANEWNELQTVRKTNPVFQIISAVFFLKVIGFENLATVDPNSNFQKEEGAYDCPDSRMARLAIAVSVYMVIALVQWVFFMFVYERFIEDKVRQFVDLCSVSNVSVFIMQYEQWGYYIHGRSVNGVADTDMWETYQQLKREEQSLRQSRGLLPNTDQQTFQMAISKKLRAHYDRVFSPLTSNQPTQMTSGPSAGPSRAIDDMRADQGIQAYLTINKFLSGYIDHSLRDIDYVVKDKLLLENVLDVELYDTFDTGVFFTDSGHSFDKVLLYGNELKLLVFDVMLFTIVDLAAHDFLLAGIICYFVTQGIVIFRNSGGKKNLARKTLVDERFLI
ncbi:PREDICTED: meckelin-like [Priapulus caudatus]|uniref:Meckelin-like n=1 Tax=Priapulus caudatus TaxID=37621 RepID=A0ABM1ES89_PRICU|nr:PREDICTED: meckelin-like [Priapulus caudatus]